MRNIELDLAAWGNSLPTTIPLGGLFARSKTAHKWKATFRSLMLREAVCWRAQDLLAQSLTLHQQGHGLGARILLRSAFETVATLIYLNQQMTRVLAGKISFPSFSQKVTVLLAVSRNDEAGVRALSILTVLEKCDKRYPGLMKLYADLSESAHPNWEGLCMGYSTINHDEYETVFSNRWMDLYGARHLEAIDLCHTVFHHEYNDVWPELFEKLEAWLEVNDEALEATKNDPLPPS